MKRIAGVAVMAALMSLSLVAVAAAHTVKHDSEITFQVKKNGNDPATFEGNVSSDKARCVAERQVAIYRRVKGGPDVVVSDDLTDANGDYSSEAAENAEPGTYYAVVIRKVLRKNDVHTHVCKKAVSQDRIVAGPPAP